MRSGCSPACRRWCRRSIRRAKLLAASGRRAGGGAASAASCCRSCRRAFPVWQHGMTTLLRAALADRHASRRRGSASCRCRRRRAGRRKLSLVDDDTIEHEILSSRLALAMMDRASWEFTDLRSRMNMLESREELDANDILRPHVLARIVTSSWLRAPLGFDAWRLLQSVLHEELSLLRRRGVPRDQPLPAAAPRAARGRPAAVHPPLEPPAARLPPIGSRAAASARRPACRRAPRNSSRRRRGRERGPARSARRRA